MPRNARVNAEDKARKTLAEAVGDYETAHPAPRDPEEEAVFGRLRDLSQAIQSRRSRIADPDRMRAARAFADVYDRAGQWQPALIDAMVRAFAIKTDGMAADKAVAAMFDRARAALPAVRDAVKFLVDRDHMWLWVAAGRDAQTVEAELPEQLRQLEKAFDHYSASIRDQLAFAYPRRKHSDSGALRFLVAIIDAYCSTPPSGPDIAEVASLALGIAVSDKMVAGLRVR
jgi:hypothetical protein